MAADWEADEAIAEAIQEGIKAGVFRHAARLNPRTAAAWNCHGDMHSERVQALLGEAMDRLGVDGAGSYPRCGL